MRAIRDGWLLVVAVLLSVLCSVQSKYISHCALKDCYCERLGDQIEVDCSSRSLTTLPEFEEIQVSIPTRISLPLYH